MKFPIAFTFLFVMVFGFNTSAQQISYVKLSLKDSLIVHRDNGQLIKLTWAYNKNVKQNTEWRKLLSDFQTNFEKIYDDVPLYDFYQIRYTNNQKLIIDEVTGTEVYNVKQQDNIEYTKSSTCIISGKTIMISVGFNDVKELLDLALIEELDLAISKIKHRFYLSMIGQEKHYFDSKLGVLLPAPRPKFSFGIVTGASLGLVKKQPYLELRTGLGVVVDKRAVVALTSDFMFNYNQDTDITETDIYVGVLMMTHYRFGTEFSLKVKGGIGLYDDMFMRAGLNYRLLSGTAIGFRYYLREKRTENVWQNMVWDFRVGYRF